MLLKSMLLVTRMKSFWPLLLSLCLLKLRQLGSASVKWSQFLVGKDLEQVGKQYFRARPLAFSLVLTRVTAQLSLHAGCQSFPSHLLKAPKSWKITSLIILWAGFVFCYGFLLVCFVLFLLLFLFLFCILQKKQGDKLLNIRPGSFHIPWAFAILTWEVKLML